MKSIGKAEFLDFEQYIKWYENISLEETLEIKDRIYNLFPNQTYREDKDYSIISRRLDDMFSLRSWASHPPEQTKEHKWPIYRAETAQNLQMYMDFSEKFSQSVQVGKWVEGEFAYIYLGNPKTGMIVIEPERYLKFVPHPDYSNMTPLDVRAALGASTSDSGPSIIPTNQEGMLTKNLLSSELEEQVSALETLKKEMKDVHDAKTGALAEMRQQIEALKADLEAKKNELMKQLREKQAELEEKKDQLEAQIFLLDSQIYAIQCYAGEVVKFGQIRRGKNAPDSEPVVLHQKLRFLDEDLGRLASLYEIEWNEISMFEDFLAHSPLAIDTFAPNERCVMLVRVSKTATQIGMDNKYPYQNMLKTYEYYHGRTIGIIIRNGENIYLGWTDEERIDIPDDLIMTKMPEPNPPSKDPEEMSDYERERYIKEFKATRKEIASEVVSRVFVYNILQGVVDNSNLLPLPKGVKLSRQSEYVLYSVADRWLTDNRFGSFSDIIKRCNEQVSKGDSILTVQRLVPESTSRWGSGRYENSRGRGDANRTHDCHLDDCTIYPINFIEYRAEVPYVEFRTADGRYGHREKLSEVPEGSTDIKEGTRGETFTSKKEASKYKIVNQYVSVSAEKGYSLCNARSNFEVYKDEYINLTYMNSVWLEWAITTKTLGGWRVGNQPVTYAYGIRYLKTAMDFIKKREAVEKSHIDAINSDITKDPDWPLKLTEWKMNNRVREITPFQAKRFAKSFSV